MPLGQAQRWGATATYGAAHFGKSLFWYAGEILFAYYMTELVGLRAVDMGVVLALGLLASAAFDLLIGAQLQATLSDPVRAARLQLIGAVLCATAFVAIFVGFWIPEALGLPYAVVSGLAFRLAFTLYDLPQNALMTVGTSSVEARDRLAATRIFFSGAASLVVALCVAPLLVMERGEDVAPRYLALACFTALVSVVSASALSRVIQKVDSTRPKQPARHVSPRLPVGPSFWLLIGVAVVTSLFSPIFGKLEPYFATYVLRSSFLGGLMVVATALGTVIGQPVWVVLRRRSTLPVVMAMAAGLQIISLGAFWFLTKRPDFGLGFAAFLFGFGSGGVGTALWAGFSETASRNARGREGFAWAVFGAAIKISLAAGILGLGMLLASAGYRMDSGADLALLMAVIPAVGAMCSIGLAAIWSARI